MLIKYLAYLVYIVISASSLLGQNDVALPRGNAGRTGEFGVTGVDGFNAVLWKSPRIFTKIEVRYEEYNVKVFETKCEFPTRVPQWNNPLWKIYGDARIYGAPSIRTFQETAPLIYRNSLIQSLNFEDGFVVSLDSTTGKRNWSFHCPKCNVSQPVVYKDLILISSRSFDHFHNGKIQALNISTGRVDWSMETNKDSISLITPTFYNGVLYFISGASYSDPWEAQSSSSSIVALDVATKTVKWSFDAKGTFDTPAIFNGTLFAGSNKDFLYAIDLETGKEKWRFKAAAHAPVTRDGSVYFNDYSNIYSVDSKSGLLKWKQKASGSVATLMAVSKSALFYGGDDNKIYAIDSLTGTVKWFAKIRGAAFEPILVKDRVFAGGTEEVLMLDAETGKSYPTVKAGANSASTPAVGDGVLYIANDDGYIFAIR